MLTLLLGGQTPAWDRPAPAAFPRRSLEWYLDRALARRAAQQAASVRAADWQSASARAADWELLDRNASAV